MDTLDSLLNKLWSDYISLNPQAKDIYDLLRKEGETVVNDHIALRTFINPEINKEKLAESFLGCGYRVVSDYDFKKKKLNAFHLEHENQSKPKVFISELRNHQLSKEAQSIINEAVREVDQKSLDDFYLTSSGRPWSANHQSYQKLLKESEYAAWVYAFGFRANHFTVLINSLKQWGDITDFNHFIKSNGFPLNQSGGETKGSPADLLEQSSTMANEVLVEFDDGSHQIPYCFYEFAKRYPLPNGDLFQGFVTSSANKIFESTDVN